MLDLLGREHAHPALLVIPVEPHPWHVGQGTRVVLRLGHAYNSAIFERLSCIKGCVSGTFLKMPLKKGATGINGSNGKKPPMHNDASAAAHISSKKHESMSVAEMDMFRIHLYNTLSGEANAAESAVTLNNVMQYREVLMDVIRVMCTTVASQIVDPSVDPVPGELYCAFPVSMSLRKQVYDSSELCHLQAAMSNHLRDAREQMQADIESAFDVAAREKMQADIESAFDVAARGEQTPSEAHAAGPEASQAADRVQMQLLYEIVKHADWNIDIMPIPHTVHAIAKSFGLKESRPAAESLGFNFPEDGVAYSVDVQKEFSKWKEGESDCMLRQQVLLRCSLLHSFSLLSAFPGRHEKSRSLEYLLIARTPMKGVQTVGIDPGLVQKAVRRGVEQERLREAWRLKMKSQGYGVREGRNVHGMTQSGHHTRGHHPYPLGSDDDDDDENTNPNHQYQKNGKHGWRSRGRGSGGKKRRSANKQRDGKQERNWE